MNSLTRWFLYMTLDSLDSAACVVVGCVCMVVQATRGCVPRRAWLGVAGVAWWSLLQAWHGVTTREKKPINTT